MFSRKLRDTQYTLALNATGEEKSADKPPKMSIPTILSFFCCSKKGSFKVNFNFNNVSLQRP